jgi:hypothetical protein
MTFENRTRGEHDHGTPETNPPTEKKIAQPDMNTPAEEKDKQDPAAATNFAGGQARNDPDGLDISQYTGPGSKPSSKFEDPEAPYHMGPGSGLSHGEETEGGDWENPDPENDSF